MQKSAIRHRFKLKAIFLTVVALLLVGGCFEAWTRLRSKLLLHPSLASSNETAVHEHFMKMAILQARRAGERGEVPIGAVVVQRNGGDDPVVLSQAHNLVETQYDASSHAELLALRQAAKKIKNWRLINTTLYTTLEPCPMCLSAAQAFRVSSIVYGAPDLRLGAIKTHIRLLDVHHPIHIIDEVVPGILENESAALMRSFFVQRRQKDSTPLKRSVYFRQALDKLLRRD